MSIKVNDDIEVIANVSEPKNGSKNVHVYIQVSGGSSTPSRYPVRNAGYGNMVEVISKGYCIGRKDMDKEELKVMFPALDAVNALAASVAIEHEIEWKELEF